MDILNEGCMWEIGSLLAADRRSALLCTSKSMYCQLRHVYFETIDPGCCSALERRRMDHANLPKLSPTAKS